jgi:hypothetical protein
MRWKVKSVKRQPRWADPDRIRRSILAGDSVIVEGEWTRRPTVFPRARTRGQHVWSVAQEVFGFPQREPTGACNYYRCGIHRVLYRYGFDAVVARRNTAVARIVLA